MYLDEEAEKQKIQMRSLIETKKSDLHVQAKINVVRQLDEDYVKMIQRGEDLKREVHEFVSNLFPTVEAEKQAIYKACAVKREMRIYHFLLRITLVESQPESTRFPQFPRRLGQSELSQSYKRCQDTIRFCSKLLPF